MARVGTNGGKVGGMAWAGALWELRSRGRRRGQERGMVVRDGEGWAKAGGDREL